MQDVAQTYNTQINEVLLTALSLAFSRWTGARSLLINLEGHGREEVIEGIELWRTMGWFTTLFPVLLDLEGTLPPAEALQAVKGQLRRLPNRGIGYGLLRFLSGNSDVVRKLEAVPKPEVAFLYMGQFDQALSESTLFVVAKESAGMSRDPQGMRQHLLDVSGFIFQGMLQLDLTFSMNVHRRSTIEGLAQNFVELLRQIISAQRAAETGYHTPADFPGARLNQQQLDQVIANLSRTQAGFTKK
jgi:non-ribosomal peptide synthase protein (TIGR01720 family)